MAIKSRPAKKTAAECHPGFAPVGKQAPPARVAPSHVRALRDARGALLFATGTKPDPRSFLVPITSGALLFNPASQTAFATSG